MWEIELSTLTAINREPEILMLSFPTFVMGNLSFILDPIVTWIQRTESQQDCRVSARQPSLVLSASRRAHPSLIWQKDPKPLKPHFSSLNETDASLWKADQLARL